MDNNNKKGAFQFLMLITTPKLADRSVEFFKQENLPLQYRCAAEGTASSEIMDMLGLGSVDKGVLISILPKELARAMLEKLKAELQLYTVNSGIAFTVSLNGINNLILRIFENVEQTSIRKDETEMTDMKHALVVAIVNRGFSGDVMEAAKSAGARGGTVFHSHHVGNEEISTAWGIDIKEEKEIVLIITESEHKIEIMKSVAEKCGMHSDANGLVLSMPVDSVTGM